jgi:hypothetical protein
MVTASERVKELTRDALFVACCVACSVYSAVYRRSPFLIRNQQKNDLCSFLSKAEDKSGKRVI